MARHNQRLMADGIPPGAPNPGLMTGPRNHQPQVAGVDRTAERAAERGPGPRLWREVEETMRRRRELVITVGVISEMF